MLSNASVPQKVLLVFGLFIALYTPLFIQNMSIRNNSVNACVRSNDGIRKPLFDFFNDAKKARLDSAKVTTGEEKQINLDAAASYERDLTYMVQAVPIEIRTDPNEPFIDCDEAYTPPFPANLF